MLKFSITVKFFKFYRLVQHFLTIYVGTQLNSEATAARKKQPETKNWEKLKSNPGTVWCSYKKLAINGFKLILCKQIIMPPAINKNLRAINNGLVVFS